MYSALAPNVGPAVPKIWSPVLNNFTSFPTDSIFPANSSPNVVILGLLRPVNNLEKYGSPRRKVHSVAVTVVAYILISSSLSLWSRFFYSFELKNLGGSIFFICNCFHFPTSSLIT